MESARRRGKGRLEPRYKRRDDEGKHARATTRKGRLEPRYRRDDEGNMLERGGRRRGKGRLERVRDEDGNGVLSLVSDARERRLGPGGSVATTGMEGRPCPREDHRIIDVSRGTGMGGS